MTIYLIIAGVLAFIVAVFAVLIIIAFMVVSREDRNLFSPYAEPFGDIPRPLPVPPNEVEIVPDLPFAEDMPGRVRR